jgi:PilZ domain-containing protein
MPKGTAVRRKADREKAKLKVFVQGVDAQGQIFREEAETYDISETGISFFLSRPVWLNTHLTLDIAGGNLFGLFRTMGAQVVRLKGDRPGREFVAARFDE